MTQTDNGKTCESRAPGLLVYGVGGDYTGARRLRRAFCILVMAVAAFTGTLFFSENYLRYDLSETQYIKALTLEDDSQRAILRNVVRRDSEQRDKPTPRYVEALAAIEEEDEILGRYEEAYQLNPKNQALIINYGCRLYLAGQYKAAREKFLEASLIQPPRNALARYLEAAALVASDPSDAALREAMNLVSRTNNNGDPILYPQPLWHESLPLHGMWHAQKQREIADRCCAPLYRFKDSVLARARTELDAGEFGEWERWLADIEDMGTRLAGDDKTEDANSGVTQTTAGLQFQYDALRMYQYLHEARERQFDEVRTAGEAVSNKLAKIENALARLRNFENGRHADILAHQKLISAPLVLIWETLGILALCWLAGVAVCRMVRPERSAWAVPHARIGQGLIIAGTSFLLLLLFLMMAMKDAENGGEAWVTGLTRVWYAVLAILVLFGPIYPAFALPAPSKAIQNTEVSAGLARKHHRGAWVTLSRRYHGILLGAFICAACLWGTGYRLVEGRYPTETKLLTTGLRAEELAAMRQARELLR